MIVKVPVTPRPPSNPAAAQSAAETAKAAALKMLETSVIDDSKAPIEAGDRGSKKVQVTEPDPDEGEPEEEKAPAITEEKEITEETEGEPEEEKAPDEEKPAAEEKKEGLPDPLKNSFERLAREKAEMRKQTESLKAREAKVAKFEMVEKAVANNDAIGALAILGIKYSTLAKQKINGAAEEEEEPDDIGAKSFDGAALMEEVRALREESRERKIASQNADLQASVKNVVKASAERFPNIAADPDLARDVVDYMINFVKQTGSPPGETLDESIQLAAEAVEAREEKQAQKYLKRKGLTNVKPLDNAPSAGTKSAGVPTTSEQVKKSKTLTNSHASTPRAVGSTTAETPEDYRAKALAILEAQGE